MILHFKVGGDRKTCKFPDKGDYDAKLRQLMLPDSQMDSEKVHLHTNIGHILYYLTLAMIK
jgi:hypothetical protein